MTFSGSSCVKSLKRKSPISMHANLMCCFSHLPVVNKFLFFWARSNRGNEFCVATRITARCRRNARCRHCTDKRLSRTLWSPLKKERMSHLCDSTVSGPTARRDNILASKCEYPPFRYPPFQCARVFDRVN